MSPKVMNTIPPKRTKIHKTTDYFNPQIFIVKTTIVPKLSRKFKANDISLYYTLLHEDILSSNSKFYPIRKHVISLQIMGSQSDFAEFSD